MNPNIDFNIDKNKLDEILARHPHEFQIATDSLPDLRQEVNKAKSFLDQVKSELYLAIRNELETANEKYTEKRLEAQVICNILYQDAFTSWCEKKAACDRVELVKDWFMCKDSALRELVRLFSATYWSVRSNEHR